MIRPNSQTSKYPKFDIHPLSTGYQFSSLVHIKDDYYSPVVEIIEETDCETLLAAVLRFIKACELTEIHKLDFPDNLDEIKGVMDRCIFIKS